MKDVLNMTIKEIEEVIKHNKKLEAELTKANRDVAELTKANERLSEFVFESANKAIDNLSETFKSAQAKETASANEYLREIKKGVYVDVYDVLKAFQVKNPAVQHAIKKLLASGKRGYKDTIQDLSEAMQSIQRAIELEDE